MKAIEMMAETIYKLRHNPFKLPEDIAQALLYLRYPCSVCKGSGLKPYLERHDEGNDDCPTCKGTGKGGKVLAVLDEKQELPDVSKYLQEAMTKWITKDKPTEEGKLVMTKIVGHVGDFIKDVQQDMLKDGWKKTVDKDLSEALAYGLGYEDCK